jgi:hypothetical protein
MRRGLEEDVPPLVAEINLKVLVVTRMVVEKIVVVLELLLNEMHLLECKRRKVLMSWRQSKRGRQL